MRAIGVSHTACKDEFRRNLRSHSWSVFSFFIRYICAININILLFCLNYDVTIHVNVLISLILFFGRCRRLPLVSWQMPRLLFCSMYDVRKTVGIRIGCVRI